MSSLLNRILEAWQNLASRERILVGTALGTVALMGAYMLVIGPFLSARSEAADSALSAESQRAAMVRLRHNYDTARSRISVLEERIQANKDRRNILTLLEALAAKADVTVESMQERQSGTDEAYRETRVEVSLKKVTLEQTVKYLHSIESADRPFSIKSLRIKRRSDGSNLLDTTFTVSSFEAV